MSRRREKTARKGGRVASARQGFVLSAVCLAAIAPESEASEARLHIRNGCAREPIWIAHEAGAGIGVDVQDVKIEPNAVVHMKTPAGLSATRYWPKMGCNEQGGDCTLGGSGGPGEQCVRRPPEVEQDDYSRCAPPIDTKFEGTFGNAAQPCNEQGIQGCDYVDMSLVDGWTLPFKLDLRGECTGIKGITKDLSIDCSGLTFDECPAAETLTAASGLNVDLRAVNPATNQMVGCYAPCMKMISKKWNNTIAEGRMHTDAEVAPYCCPTPPETPEMCRQGPIIDTHFLKAVHGRCPGVYGYAYDDGMGLLRCNPQTVYELTFFCPDSKTDFQSTKLKMRAVQRARLRAGAKAHNTTEREPSSLEQTLLGKKGKDDKKAKADEAGQEGKDKEVADHQKAEKSKEGKDTKEETRTEEKETQEKKKTKDDAQAKKEKRTKADKEDREDKKEEKDERVEEEGDKEGQKAKGQKEAVEKHAGSKDKSTEKGSSRKEVAEADAKRHAADGKRKHHRDHADHPEHHEAKNPDEDKPEALPIPPVKKPSREEFHFQAKSEDVKGALVETNGHGGFWYYLSAGVAGLAAVASLQLMILARRRRQWSRGPSATLHCLEVEETTDSLLQVSPSSDHELQR